MDVDKLKKFDNLPIEKKIQLINIFDVLSNNEDFEKLLDTNSDSLGKLSTDKQSSKQKTLDSWLIKSKNTPSRKANERIPELVSDPTSRSNSEIVELFSSSIFENSEGNSSSENVITDENESLRNTRSNKQSIATESISNLKNRKLDPIVVIKRLTFPAVHEEHGLSVMNRICDTYQDNLVYITKDAEHSEACVLPPELCKSRKKSVENVKSSPINNLMNSKDADISLDCGEVKTKVEIPIKRTLRSNSFKNEVGDMSHFEKERYSHKKKLQHLTDSNEKSIESSPKKPLPSKNEQKKKKCFQNSNKNNLSSSEYLKEDIEHSTLISCNATISDSKKVSFLSQEKQTGENTLKNKEHPNGSPKIMTIKNISAKDMELVQNLKVKENLEENISSIKDNASDTILETKEEHSRLCSKNRSFSRKKGKKQCKIQLKNINLENHVCENEEKREKSENYVANLSERNKEQSATEKEENSVSFDKQIKENAPKYDMKRRLRNASKQNLNTKINREISPNISKISNSFNCDEQSNENYDLKTLKDLGGIKLVEKVSLLSPKKDSRKRSGKKFVTEENISESVDYSHSENTILDQPKTKTEESMQKSNTLKEQILEAEILKNPKPRKKKNAKKNRSIKAKQKNIEKCKKNYILYEADKERNFEHKLIGPENLILTDYSKMDVLDDKIISNELDSINENINNCSSSQELPPDFCESLREIPELNPDSNITDSVNEKSVLLSSVLKKKCSGKSQNEELVKMTETNDEMMRNIQDVKHSLSSYVLHEEKFSSENSNIYLTDKHSMSINEGEGRSENKKIASDLNNELLASENDPSSIKKGRFENCYNFNNCAENNNLSTNDPVNEICASGNQEVPINSNGNGFDPNFEAFNKLRKTCLSHGLKLEEIFERKEFKKMIETHGNNKEAIVFFGTRKSTTTNKIEPILSFHKSKKVLMAALSSLQSKNSTNE